MNLIQEFNQVYINHHSKKLIKLSKDFLKSMLIIFIGMVYISKPVLNLLLLYFNVPVTSNYLSETLDLQIKFVLITMFIFGLPMFLNLFTYFIERYNKEVIIKIWTSFILAVTGFVFGLTTITKQIMFGLYKGALVIPKYTIGFLFNFGFSIGFITALSFQLILLIPILVKYNLIDISNIKPVNICAFILITYFICAILTPSDLTSTFITMIPMNLSTFIGIKLSKKEMRKRK